MFRYIRHSFAVQGHSTASFVIFLSFIFAVSLNAELNQFNYRNVEILKINVLIQDVLKRTVNL